MNNYNCEIAADSLNTFGNRITTFILTYPRIVHSELMTHRVFSRNAASSRAVPVKKMIESVRNNMFTPLAVQKAHKGMQGSDYFEGVELEQAKQLWIESAELALQQAEKMEKFGITKQLINRILEPYQYYQVLVTATEWENFFSLRCPKYYAEGINKHYRSWKDLSIDFPACENYSELDRLKVNQSQAEIHIQKIAEMMYDAMNESNPEQLAEGMWHIPFMSRIDSSKLKSVRGKDITEEMVKISTAMAARTSYTVIGDGKEIDYQKMIELHDRLIEMRHDSPFEHCAKAMSDEEYQNFRKGYTTASFRGETRGWANNYRGFVQYRYLIENQ